MLSTGPLQIFYQNDHELAVGVLDQTARENNPRIIIIDRKFVAAIVLQKVPRWFRLTRLP
jgi:hypothetical protein